MKKLFIVAATFLIIAFADIASASAINISYSQSGEITVGEVDKIDSDDKNTIYEKQEVHTPETGLFGLETNQASVAIAVCLCIPAVVILVWLLRYIYHRYTR